MTKLLVVLLDDAKMTAIGSATMCENRDYAIT